MQTPEDQLSILSQTIQAHARKVAHEEWNQEHLPALKATFDAAGLTDTLRLQEREVPIEAVYRAIRDAFLEGRGKALQEGLCRQLVSEAFKKIDRDG